MDQSYQLIDGIKSYAPDIAFGNSGFQPELFEKLFEIEEKHFWFRSRNRILCGLFAKYLGLSKSASYLEIGCGTGYVLKGLSELTNLKVMGAEVHIEALRFARQRLPRVEFIQMDAMRLPFYDDFDVIGAFDVLEHIEDDVSVMKNVGRALKKGGLFFITVPQHSFLWSTMDDIAFHKRRYSRKELLTKLAASGFAVEFASSFAFTVFPFMLASRIVKKSTGPEKGTNDVLMSELRLSGIVNSTLGLLMRLDELLVRSSIRLPFGGSLVVVARKVDR